MNHLHLEKEYIFEDDRPFRSCHASSLAHLSNHEVLVAWFGGTEEGHADVDIWCSRRKKGKWEQPYKICAEEGLPHWNPVLFKGDNEVLYLYYKVGHTISNDEGLTWSDPRELVEGDIGGRGPVRNKPIILQNGTWLAPASIEKRNWDVFIDISKDQGKTWIKSSLISVDHSLFQGEGLIQPTLWESEPGEVHMLIRSSEGSIYRSDSVDNGESWSEAYPTALPNNNSGIDLVKLENGVLALIYNPVAENWGPRTPLVISYSHDNGASWEDEIVLETAEGEYSYPAIVSKDNQIYVSYTWKRERIVYREITQHFPKKTKTFTRNSHQTQYNII